VVHDYYPSIGGVEIQTKNLAEGLSKKGYNNIVFTKHTKSSYPEEETINDVEIVRKAYPATNSSFFLKLIGLVLNTRYLFVNRCRYQIIHLKAPFFELMIPCWLLKMFSNIKVVYALSIDGELPSVQGKMLSSLKKAVKRTMLMSFDAIISMNNMMSKEIEDFGVPREKILFIINGVETDRFVPDITKKIPGRVIFIGRIDIDHKGVDVLLKSWKGLCKEYDQYHLVVAGPFASDKNISTLKDYVKLNRLEDKVSFVGEINYYSSDIVDYYQSGELFILSSRYEGMPETLMQAMSCGLPVISTRVGAAAELVFEGVNGFLANVDDVSSLSSDIKGFFDLDESKRIDLGKRSREIIIENYGQEKRINQFVELFSSIS